MYVIFILSIYNFSFRHTRTRAIYRYVCNSFGELGKFVLLSRYFMWEASNIHRSPIHSIHYFVRGRFQRKNVYEPFPTEHLEIQSFFGLSNACTVNFCLLVSFKQIELLYLKTLTRIDFKRK